MATRSAPVDRASSHHTRAFNSRLTFHISVAVLFGFQVVRLYQGREHTFHSLTFTNRPRLSVFPEGLPIYVNKSRPSVNDGRSSLLVRTLQELVYNNRLATLVHDGCSHLQVASDTVPTLLRLLYDYRNTKGSLLRPLRYICVHRDAAVISLARSAIRTAVPLVKNDHYLAFDFSRLESPQQGTLPTAAALLVSHHSYPAAGTSPRYALSVAQAIGARFAITSVPTIAISNNLTTYPIPSPYQSALRLSSPVFLPQSISKSSYLHSLLRVIPDADKKLYWLVYCITNHHTLT